MPEGVGLIKPAGLARPQPGLQPAAAHDDGTLHQIDAPGASQTSTRIADLLLSCTLLRDVSLWSDVSGAAALAA